MPVSIIDPNKYSHWDTLLLHGENSDFFHTAVWSRTLCETYSLTPLFFTHIDRDRLTGLIALMEVNSLLTGKRGVSLPFTDECNPIAENEIVFNKMFHAVVEYGQQAGWKSIEFRGGLPQLSNIKPAAEFFTHHLDITKPENQMLASFRGSTRRNIKKAMHHGIRVHIENSLAATEDFFRLNCLTRRDHGLPPQPYGFFKNLHKHVLNKDRGKVFLAVHSGKPIAGAVFTAFNKKAIFKYGASDKKYFHLRGNNLVMWEAIRYYAAKGFSSIDFGRTEPAHNGLLQFKRGWGTIEKSLHYYKYDFSKKDFNGEQSRLQSSYRLFRKMPMPLLKLTGKLLYRHVA